MQRAHLERFLSGMLANVSSQDAGCCERFTAVDTFVRSLSAVHLYMCIAVWKFL